MPSLPAYPSSLQQFIDSADAPTFVLDFRLPQYLNEPSEATIFETSVSRNEACKLERFNGSVEALLAQRLENGALNPKLQARDPVLGIHTKRHTIGRDIWICSSVGPYRIWTLQLDEESEDGITPKSHNITESRQVTCTCTSANGEAPGTSREQQLFNKLDHIQGPLKAFYHLADQALSDVQRVIKDSEPSNPSKSQDIISNLHPIELNLRTLSSGLSLLRDLSDISSYTPPPKEPPTPKEAPSDQALLSKILGRVHAIPSNTSPAYHGTSSIQDYKIPPNLEAHTPTLRALIVEDNLVNSKIFTRLAQKLGVLPEYITPAFNGAEGLEIIENMVKRGQFPDIILVDHAMPVMDGMEFLKRYWARWPDARARVLGLTVHQIADRPSPMEKMGVNGIVQKPMRWRTLQYELERAATLKMTREIEFRGKL
ncbi:hypothetical protein TWF173_005298 [Orbilia oligospora]|nr:hypothetical protein TWF173_005298 [Orbilia oligospora]